MKSVGLDAVEMERIELLLKTRRDRFLQRVYTPVEQALAYGRESELTFYAGRFAAKEAVLKALGTGWAGGIRFTDVEVLREPGGAARVELHGLAAEKARELGISRVLVSISHTRRDAYAVAFAE